MGTYSSSSDIKLDTGKSIVEMLDEDLTDDERQSVLRAARERAFNTINKSLRGKTAIPAYHIEVLKQIEIDFCLADILAAAYTMESMNKSDWVDTYRTRAEEALKSLYFEGSAEEPIVYRGNTGNGSLKVIDVFSAYAKTEQWTFIALSDTLFAVTGSLTGAFPNLTVGVSYPEKDWCSTYGSDYGLPITGFPSPGKTPFICKIAAGDIPFEEGDTFTFQQYASSSKKSSISVGKIRRA